jgi:O-antigen/teichoic acid export membrane protein
MDSFGFKRFSAKWRNHVSGDPVFRRLARNVGYLFSANAMVSGLGLLTLSVMAYGLGPAGLGVVAIIEAYVRSVDRVLRFEPWQAVVRYGSTALENKDRSRFSRLIKASTLFDIAGACAAAIAAILLADLVMPRMGLDEAQTPLAVMFAVSLFFNLAATPTAVLRLFDKFDLIAKFSVLLALLRLLMVAVAWQLGAGLWSFVIILAIYQAASALVPLAVAWRELAHQGFGITQVFASPLRGVLAANAGIERFVWNSNLNVILRTATQRFDILIVGAILGPAATGIYQLARRTGQAAMVFGRPIQQAIYPDIARLWARGEFSRFSRILLITNGAIFLCGCLGLLVVALNIEPLVQLFFGKDFLVAAPLIVVQGFAIVLFLAGNTLNPALLSMGRDNALVLISLTASAIFFVVFVPFLKIFGVMGGSIAHVVFNVVWLTGCILVLLRTTSNAIASDPDMQES